jgi:hypothetical protein
MAGFGVATEDTLRMDLPAQPPPRITANPALSSPAPAPMHMLL